MAKPVADRKRQILMVATELFSKGGFDKVTMSELARACGITEPAVYRHFKSKEAIYDAVLDSIEQRMDTIRVFDQLAHEEDIEPILEGIAGSVISFFQTNEDIHRLLLFSALNDHDKARNIYDITRGRYVRFLREQLERLVKAGRIVEKNNEITARCFVGMVFDCALGQTLWKKFAETKFAPEEVIANNVPIYAGGLRKS
jgi:AcrR family transcriptional regulator